MDRNRLLIIMVIFVVVLVGVGLSVSSSRNLPKNIENTEGIEELSQNILNNMIDKPYTGEATVYEASTQLTSTAMFAFNAGLYQFKITGAGNNAFESIISDTSAYVKGGESWFIMPQEDQISAIEAYTYDPADLTPIISKDNFSGTQSCKDGSCHVYSQTKDGSQTKVLVSSDSLLPVQIDVKKDDSSSFSSTYNYGDTVDIAVPTSAQTLLGN